MTRNNRCVLASVRVVGVFALAVAPSIAVVLLVVFAVITGSISWKGMRWGTEDRMQRCRYFIGVAALSLDHV